VVGLACFAIVLVAIAALSARANRVHGLRVDVLSARRAEPGHEIKVTVSVRDTKGALRAVEVDFGDGRVDTPDVGGGQGEACAEPFTGSVDFVHAFDFAGVTTVTARVTTGGCGADPETVEAIRTIEVRPLRR
jgi:hypothetical protein